jgi:hypothetical protein
MSKSCVYFLNQNPIYRGIFSVSIRLLRKYNPDLPVTLFYVEDSGLDSYLPSSQLVKYISAENAKKYLKTEEHELFDLCKELNVDLRRVPIPVKNLNGFNSTHRIYLKEIQDTSVLLLDVDTFIFDNLDFLFDTKLDFVADNMQSYYPSTDGQKAYTEKTFWVFNYEKDKNPENPVKVRMSPFNSGVVVFNNGTASDYGRQVLNYCNRLLLKKHPLSEVMYAHRDDARNREECACTLFVLENNLTWDYFDKKDVQTYNLEFPVKIFHTTNSAWPYFFDAFVKQNFLEWNYTS